MAITSTGWLSCGTADGVSIGGGESWDFTDNIKTDNNLGAVCDFTSFFSERSHWLVGSNFGAAIPTDSTILGVEVRVKAKLTAGSEDEIIRLRLGYAPTLSYFDSSGDTYYITSTEGLTTSYQVFIYGSSTDLWNATWTPTQVNDSNFSAGAYFLEPANYNEERDIDYIQVRVHYSTFQSDINGLSGITSGEAIGTLSVVQLSPLSVTGLSSAEVVPSCTVTSEYTLSPVAVESGFASGVAELEGHLVLYPSGLVSATQFGNLSAVYNTLLEVSGIASGEYFVETHVAFDGSLNPGSISSSESFGAFTLGRDIQAEPIFEGAFGDLVIAQIITVAIASLEAVGTAIVGNKPVFDGIASLEVLGVPLIGLHICTIGFYGSEVPTPSTDTYTAGNEADIWIVRFR